MKKLTIALCAFATSIFACCTTFAADSSEKYTLKLQYPVGEYTMTLKMDSDITIERDGEEMPVKQSQTMTLAMTVTEEGSDGGKKVSMEMKRVETALEMARMKMALDSNSEDDMKNPAMKQYEAMLNTKLSTIYDKDGNVVKVEGLDEMWDKMDKNSPFVEAMKESMGGKAFTQGFEQAAARFPQTPVAIGETWKIEAENRVPMLGKLKTVSESTLKNVEKTDGKQLATIEAKEEFIGEEELSTKAGPVKITYKNIKMKSDAISKIDVDSGFVTSSVGNMDISADMEAQNAVASSEKATMTMSGKHKMEMNLVPVKK